MKIGLEVLRRWRLGWKYWGDEDWVGSIEEMKIGLEKYWGDADRVGNIDDSHGFHIRWKALRCKPIVITFCFFSMQGSLRTWKKMFWGLYILLQIMENQKSKIRRKFQVNLGIFWTSVWKWMFRGDLLPRLCWRYRQYSLIIIKYINKTPVLSSFINYLYSKNFICTNFW